MATQWWNDDDQLLEVLREAVTIAREMPADFVAVGKAAYAWRTIDAELAALTYDSAWQTEELSLTRAESAELRMLTFASEGLTIELVSGKRVGDLKSHGKMMLIDDETVVIGSLALAALSLDFRREVAIVVNEPSAVADAVELFRALREATAEGRAAAGATGGALC